MDGKSALLEKGCDLFVEGGGREGAWDEDECCVFGGGHREVVRCGIRDEMR